MYHELKYLLAQFGYAELKAGNTSGSRVAFWNKEKQDIIRLHKPHPGNELKDYQRKLIKSHLQNNKWL
ncbi:MAG: type II toxin-antitoxin system HicA family toxin [Saprospiraceae bacterium]